MSPLQYFLELPQSEGGLGWSSSEFGLFIGSRGFFNVYLLMLFVSGVILDKTGVRFAGMLSCVLMLVGTAIDYYAIAIASPVPATEVTFPTLGLDHTMVKDQVLMSAFGFAVFGIGYELCGITVSKVIVKWFSGKEMALAMGIQVALARFGTALALLGGHGKELVIADSIAHYDDDNSRTLTALALNANVRMREIGFKPFVAPAYSSGVLSILATLRGDWHYGSVFLGGSYMGVKNRYTTQGQEHEILPLPDALMARIYASQASLRAIN